MKIAATPTSFIYYENNHKLIYSTSILIACGEVNLDTVLLFKYSRRCKISEIFVDMCRSGISAKTTTHAGVRMTTRLVPRMAMTIAFTATVTTWTILRRKRTFYQSNVERNSSWCQHGLIPPQMWMERTTMMVMQRTRTKRFTRPQPILIITTSVATMMKIARIMEVTTLPACVYATA
jgi:uncharacterized membrane protein YobD (UPF0266 family)